MRIALIVVPVVVAMASCAVLAQSLDVSLASISPEEKTLCAGTAFDYALAAFRFEAGGASVDIDGLILTVAGTGDFSAHLAPGTGVQAWLDDGDGEFDSAIDSQLAATSGSSSTIMLPFSAPVSVASGADVAIWIVLSFLADRGISPFAARTYSVSIADPADVIAPAGNVLIGVPEPASAIVTVGCPTKPGRPIEKDCSIVPGAGHSTLLLLIGLWAAVMLRRLRVSSKARLHRSP